MSGLVSGGGVNTGVATVTFPIDVPGSFGVAEDADIALGVGNSFTAGANQNAAQLQLTGTIAEFAGASTHTVIAQLLIPTPTITNDATAVTTKAASVYIQNAPSGITPTDGGPYALFVDGGESRFDGPIVGPFSGTGLLIGEDAAANSADVVLIQQDRVSSLAMSLLKVQGTIEQTDVGITYGVQIQPTLTKSTGATTTNFASLYVKPDMSLTAGSVTNASTVFIDGAPSIGTNQYALRVGSGLAFFGGGLRMDDNDKIKLGTADDAEIYFDATNLVIDAQAAGIQLTGAAIGCFDVTPQAQQATIADADGTLEDITTKFNTLLADLEGYGLLASA